jgi:hypothetical protein
MLSAEKKAVSYAEVACPFFFFEENTVGEAPTVLFYRFYTRNVARKTVMASWQRFLYKTCKNYPVDSERLTRIEGLYCCCMMATLSQNVNNILSAYRRTWYALHRRASKLLFLSSDRADGRWSVIALRGKKKEQSSVQTKTARAGLTQNSRVLLVCSPAFKFLEKLVDG